MESLVNTVKGAALSVGEALTPILKDSKFKETGVLTPEEFVAAGNYLVYHCPTWSWARAADSSKTRSYLPEDKQFLVTRNVPCYRRCIEMDYDPAQEKVLSTEEVFEGDCNSEFDDWVDTHHYVSDKSNEIRDIEEDLSNNGNSAQASDEDQEPVDMDEYIACGAFEVDDPNRFVSVKTSKNKESEDSVLKTRTYNLHITYDKYYQVPRFWLSGYNEAKVPLTTEEMNEDFSQDHARKTITIENHPHLYNTVMATIHPCRHAEVMKRLMEQIAENGKELTVEHYLLIFLKFVQAVIPTIEYDYTRGVQL
uniref:Autophagy-related protein 3 n=1 Tax=Syphacia muris TaxID=451379 RepID=A0A0N5AR04_9BILA